MANRDKLLLENIFEEFRKIQSNQQYTITHLEQIFSE